ncbi:MAG: MFS transporter [Chloroflexota bacterium]|nr:MFS transporter [Chloroflexota bacterium]
MTSKTSTSTPPKQHTFQFGQAFTIASGHFVHDIYTAFIAPLLPIIIEKLSLSLTQAGALISFRQIPAILTPFIGHLADRVSMRYFVIFAPAVTATLIVGIGIAPNYFTLALLLFFTGISVAVFHAPAPAIVARVSGRRVGVGMSLYMAGGELARTLGPLLAVWAASIWGLEGIYRTVVIGWASSLILLWRFRKISSKEYQQKQAGLGRLLLKLRPLFIPLFFFLLARVFSSVCMTIYLPTFLNLEGASLKFAGVSLSILEAAGVVGALTSGTISDRIGRKPTLIFIIAASAPLMIAFLSVDGWLRIPILLLLGFVSLSTGPVVLALVQDSVPENHRAAGNGIYMCMSFLISSAASPLIGLVGDTLGLRAAFWGSALISLLAIPALLALPEASE